MHKNIDIYLFDLTTRNLKCIYECVENFVEADLLCQLEMRTKTNPETVVIVFPGYNRGIEGTDLTTALELSEKYKVEK